MVKEEEGQSEEEEQAKADSSDQIGDAEQDEGVPAEELDAGSWGEGGRAVSSLSKEEVARAVEDMHRQATRYNIVKVAHPLDRILLCFQR